MKIMDVFGGITNIIRGTVSVTRLGPVREPYPHGDLLQQAVLRWIFEMVEKAGATEIYAPDPIKENGLVIEPRPIRKSGRIVDPGYPEFDQLITIPESTVRCFRGMDKAYADGIILPDKTAIFMFPADCLTINVVDVVLGKSSFEHGPRESTRRNLIPAVMEKFRDSKKENLRVMLCFGIQPEHFDHPFNHPVFGSHNQEMVEEILERWPKAIVGNPKEGKIWLHMLAAQRFMEYGVPAENIFFDDMDTYAERRPNGQFAYWSARRDRKEREKRQKSDEWTPLETPALQRPRNLVISINRGSFSPKWDWRTVPGIHPVSEIMKT